MPGAYLKGNSSFPGSTFVVDEISKSWNAHGVVDAIIINEQDFTPDSHCTIKYYKLKHIIFLHIDAVLKPSSLPYTGVQDDTSYIYTGDFTFSKVNTTANVRLTPALASASYHFQNTLNIEDLKSGVFFDTNVSFIMGTVHINGIIDSTEIVITAPTGMLPNHEYNVCGTLIYQSL